MANLYARATALPNVRGRIDYLKNPNKQEHLLAIYDSAADLLDGCFWEQLSKESQDAFEQYGEKSRTITKRNGETVTQKLKCCEGREIMIQLSNALIDRMTPEAICKTIADTFKEELGLTVAIGLHLKSKDSEEDNLHAHVVFPERQLLSEPEVKIAERALFFDADGKRRYKKSEILDENKQLLPGCRIIPKGEVYEKRCFGSVDHKYSAKSWLKDVKTNVILPLRNGKLKGDVEITEYSADTGKLPQQHIGKKASSEAAEKIKEYNESVKEYNAIIDAQKVPPEATEHVQSEMKKSKRRNNMIKVLIERLKKLLKNLEFLEKQNENRSESLADKIAGAEQSKKTDPQIRQNVPDRKNR